MSKSIQSRSRRGLFLALILGLIAALGTYAYVDLNTRQIQKQPKTATVVVARQDIPAKVRLTPNMLSTREVPLETRHPAALTSIADANGKVTGIPLTSGEQVLTTKFKSEKEEKLNLARMVPPGHRAMAVTFSEVIGSGGLIIPGDRVDVIAVFDAKTMGKDQAVIMLQDIQVLAVAQAIEGDEEMPVEGKITTATAQSVQRAATAANTSSGIRAPGSSSKPEANKQPALTEEQDKATARPQAKSATLAVTPEQAQRLALAEATGKLRLTLRAVKDGSTVDLPEAVLSKIKEPFETADAVITAAEISPSNVKPGDTINVKITVRNTSNVLLKSQGPVPDFVYVQGQTYHSQDYQSMPGTYRVGVNIGGQSSAPYPYRWGLGGDLAPGATATIEGQIKVIYDFKPTNFWVGLIHEPADVVQDAVAITLVTALPANIAVVAVDAANVRSGPGVSSAIVTQVPYGKELPILGNQNDWYKVRLEDGREGWVAAGWIVTSSGR
ncbi:MAG: Flp pilus assembly protein CpaB [Chloroflexi bacterium]|nr:Flp pilus assembly protein CpaB [Chloroflexota bacterium]